jgi:hypothetical protein
LETDFVSHPFKASSISRSFIGATGRRKLGKMGRSGVNRFGKLAATRKVSQPPKLKPLEQKNPLSRNRFFVLLVNGHLLICNGQIKHGEIKSD